MKSDLDRLMEERGLDAAIVSGRLYGNPALRYMLGDVVVSLGIVVKKRGEEPVVIHSSYERDEAVACGLPLIDLAKYRHRSISRQERTPLEGEVHLYRQIFDDLGVRGNVGFYGRDERGAAWMFLQEMEKALPDVRVFGEYSENLISVARATKDASEIALMKEAARLTCEVIEATMDFVRRHAVKDEMLVIADGSPLTIGLVKKEISRLLAERRMEQPEGFIFSIGRDAGVGHSTGRPNDHLRLGQSIVFDLYPRLAGSYFCDCTRTFCLGYAPPEVEKAYADVKACFDTVLAKIAVGLETRMLQRAACEFFEGRGHVTIAQDPQTEEGYVHSIGHGVGLALHEEPAFGDRAHNTRVLQVGHVFTVEPGVYYPERGYGVRIEDVIWIDLEGRVCKLTDLPQELVLEMV